MAKDFWRKGLMALALAGGAWLLLALLEALLTPLGLSAESGLLAERLALSLVWLTAAHLLNVLIGAFFWHGLVLRALGRTPPRLVEQLGNLLVMLLALAGIVGVVFEQPVTGLWATSGAIGIVVGLALRNLILDTFSGLAIHIEQPFRVGDWITCHTRFGTYFGRVLETNWRTTRLATNSRNVVVIPNSFLTSTIVTNTSMPDDVSGFEVKLVLDFSVPTERALRILGAATQQSVGPDGILAEPRPDIEVNATTPDGIEYKISYSIQADKVPPGRARSLLLRMVIAHLRNAGISLSYPRRDIFLARMPWRQRNWHYDKDQVRQLAQLPLFASLSNGELQQLATEMAVFPMQQGETVVSQGDVGDSMFVLAEGLLHVSVTREDGSQFQVAELGPGEFFGERSLLTGEPRSATVVCAVECVVCEITKDAVSSLLAENPALAQAFSRAVIAREMHNGQLASQLRQRELSDRIDAEAGQFARRLRQFFGLTKT